MNNTNTIIYYEEQTILYEKKNRITNAILQSTTRKWYFKNGGDRLVQKIIWETRRGGIEW